MAVGNVLIVTRNYGTEVYADVNLHVTYLDLKEGRPAFVLPGQDSLPFDELADDERAVLAAERISFE